MNLLRRPGEFIKWLPGVVSVLLGIAGFYWLSIILGWSLGTSESARLVTRFSSYLAMFGLPAALLAAVFNRLKFGGYILGATFLLFIAPVTYLWTSAYIESKDVRMQNAMKARISIEKTSDTPLSCNGNSIYFQESRWGTSVALLKPVADEIKPVYLAIFNVHE
jgi:hypothetical protein